MTFKVSNNQYGRPTLATVGLLAWSALDAVVFQIPMTSRKLTQQRAHFVWTDRLLGPQAEIGL